MYLKDSEGSRTGGVCLPGKSQNQGKEPVKMKKKEKAVKKLLISLIITIASVVAGLLFNMVNPNGIEVLHGSTGGGTANMVVGSEAGDNEALKGSPDGAVPEGVIEHITLEAAKEYFDKGKGLFVDARSQETYAIKHIRGAVSLSAGSFDKSFEEFSDAIAKDTLLVIYCQSITCSKSDIVAEKLRAIGYRHIKVFVGGWVEWLSAGYPVQGV